ncbi:MAG: helix-turn-helix domain-containing protein [Ardenticatenaceae bacterium]|nr:helix-turn-helix domain-containing protein [Ardenticatenaceae bacterium]
MDDSTNVFEFEGRPSDSPFVEAVWSTRSLDDGSFVSTAETHWEMVVSRYQGELTITMRGPETQAKRAPFNKDTEYFGIVFKHGSFMPHLPVSQLVNENVNLPSAVNGRFWLNSAAWELPTLDTVDDFIAHLVRQELLIFDPLVQAVLAKRPLDLSPRTIQRRFLRATGITQGTFEQIERAKQATTLLQQGTPIVEATFEAGYADQPHLTRSLKRFIGFTPAQIYQSDSVE